MSQTGTDASSCSTTSTYPRPERRLERRGEFFPFGASIAADGETKMIAGDPGQGEHPLSNDVVSIMVDGYEPAVTVFALRRSLRMSD